MSLLDYLPYCITERQEEVIRAIHDHEGVVKASRALEVGHATVSEILRKVKARAAKKGFSPGNDMKKPLAEGISLKRISTNYDSEGNVKQQWVIGEPEKEKIIEAIHQQVDALKEELPKESPATAPTHSNQFLLSKYVITDYHIGMMSWHEETGDDWDLSIAENLLIEWFKSATSLAPDSKIGVLAQLGDFLHWDGMEAVTPTSKSILDADTRFQKLVRVSVRVLRRAINILLAKHEKVHVICAEGNHDLASSIWLRECLSVMYQNEPRITVDCNPDPYYCYTFGKNCFFFHHGHKKKMSAIDSVFVAKFRKEYGSAEYHFADLGHLHHEKVLESNLMVLEQHRTLAAADAHASRGGWMSGRHSKVTTYHRDCGKVLEHIISPKFIEGGYVEDL